MTTRRTSKIEVPAFCPSWGTLVESYIPEGSRFPITVGDIVKVQFRKYETICEALVRKIVASKETGEVAELDLVVQGDGRKWTPNTATIKHERECRTVTPDKIRRIPRNRQEEEEDMKVSGYKGELPKRTSGGRTRQPNPFDEHVAKGGQHQVTLEKGDDPKKVKYQIQKAARDAKKSARVFTLDDGTLVFVVVAKQTRKTAAAAEGDAATE